MADSAERNSDFCSSLCNLTNNDDIEAVLKGQRGMLARIEKTNHMILNCNNISEQQLEMMTSRYRRHTNVLKDMKKDLQSVHARIRRLKRILELKNPDSWTIIEEEANKKIVLKEMEKDSPDLMDFNNVSINDGNPEGKT
uniref:KxDL motif-containing protein 1 n=1 Tax=Ciona intestinalis TaxID=7719 RepID=H2XP14_CIOIN|nr:kxDL motif-containing protein 1-like [Ciona intestinalis]|eukprot:XP_026689891.1 kxDL motif-containing protein 1-like [Ciona intestinalis]